MTTMELDQAKQEAFGERLAHITNSAFLGLGLSVGHQTGLFDTLSKLPPATSEQIARAAGLQERYVREWLSAMTVGQIVEYRPADRTYRLPPEHAAFTTTAAGPDNLASFNQFVVLAAGVEQDLIGCFRSGGGVPYPRYERFQKIMAADSGAILDHTLIANIVPLVPGLAGRLAQGIDVVDVGCGSGHAVNLLARQFPASRFTGLDFSAEGIAAARTEALGWGLTNTRFVEQDAALWQAASEFDLATAFDAIHDQAHPRRVLANIARALRPGGTLLMADIAASTNLEDNIEHPFAPALYTLSLFHCMTVSLAHEGEGLGTMWGEQKACELLAEAGFMNVEVKRVDGDAFNNYYLARV